MVITRSRQKRGLFFNLSKTSTSCSFEPWVEAAVLKQLYNSEARLGNQLNCAVTGAINWRLGILVFLIFCRPWRHLR